MPKPCSQRWCLITVAVCVALSIDSAPARADAGSNASSPADDAPTLRARGLQLGYSLDHADALTAFKNAIDADPTDPAAYRLTAATAWIDLLFEQGAITVDDYLGQARANLAKPTPSAGLDRAFHEALNRALTISEQRLRNHPRDADAHYQAGAAYGYLASYTATIEGRLLGSFSPARRAYREHQRVLQLDPRRKDAGLVVGMYDYAISSLPAPLRLMAHLVGFSGQRERALRLVEEAAQYPSDAQPNALFTLILLYNREARYDDALRVIHDLQQRFPRNRLLWLEAGNTALRAGRPAEASAALEEGLARMASDVRPRAVGEMSRWAYAHGAAQVALKNRAAAMRELRVALADATRDWVRGRAHRELGKLADLAGDRDAAIDEYRQADRLCRQDRDDECSDEVRRLTRSAYK